MLHLTTYFIREHLGILKLSDTYDLLDPATNQQIGVAKEEISGFMKLLRLLVNKQMLPTQINVYESSDGETLGDLQFSIKRGFTFMRSQVDVLNGEGESIGYFKSKLFTLGGAFRVFSTDNQEVALVKGDWKGFNFRFLQGEKELGTVTKQWGGLGKELFTSADNYVVSFEGEPNPVMTILLLAAGLAVDCVYKEKG
jgi:uncharacterized protein YxjI